MLAKAHMGGILLQSSSFVSVWDKSCNGPYPKCRLYKMCSAILLSAPSVVLEDIADLSRQATDSCTTKQLLRLYRRGHLSRAAIIYAEWIILFAIYVCNWIIIKNLDRHSVLLTASKYCMINFVVGNSKHLTLFSSLYSRCEDIIKSN